MTEEHARIAVLERRVEDLHEWAGELKNAVAESAKSNSAAIRELTTVVSELAGMKTDHERHSVEIGNLRKRQHEIANNLGRITLVETKVDHAEKDILTLQEFKEDILRKLPTMQLASGWVFKSALSVIGILSIVATMVIIKGGAQ